MALGAVLSVVLLGIVLDVAFGAMLGLCGVWGTIGFSDFIVLDAMLAVCWVSLDVVFGLQTQHRD